MMIAHHGLLMGAAAGGGSFGGTHLAVAHSTSPFITIYNRSGNVFTKVSNPGTLPAGIGFCAAFSPDGGMLAVGHNGSPFVTIYSRSGDTFTKLSNPGTLPADAGFGVAWSPSGSFLAVAHDISPFITIYSVSGTTFTKLSNPATLPAGTGRGVAFSADGSMMAVAHSASPFITIYSISGTTFTKLADPATLPAATQPAFACAFSPNGQFLTVSSGTGSPQITIYEITAGPTFTKLSNPSLTTAFEASWAPGSDYLTAGNLYSRSGTTFSVVTRAAFPGGGGSLGGAFSVDGGFVAYALNATPFVGIYTLVGGVLTLLSNPATLPAGVGRGIAWNPV